jgi:CDP-diacylglycerol--glycerol-3-phosphate 3-phosphatidyltransferase
VSRSEAPRTRVRLGWLPNALTIARLAALPVLLVVLLSADGPTSKLGGAIFVAVAATDVLDGFLARRLGAETRFGRIADPLADRLLVGVGLVGVLLLGAISPAAPAILIARDVTIVGGAVLLLRRGIEMRVDMAGKISSTLTMLATAAALLLDQPWVEPAVWVAVVVALATFANYARQAAATLRRVEETSTRP